MSDNCTRKGTMTHVHIMKLKRKGMEEETSKKNTTQEQLGINSFIRKMMKEMFLYVCNLLNWSSKYDFPSLLYRKNKNLKILPPYFFMWQLILTIISRLRDLIKESWYLTLQWWYQPITTWIHTIFSF